MDKVVVQPSDWSSYPPVVGGSAVGYTNLKSYTERKSAIEGADQADTEILELIGGSSSRGPAVERETVEIVARVVTDGDRGGGVALTHVLDVGRTIRFPSDFVPRGVGELNSDYLKIIQVEI